VFLGPLTGRGDGDEEAAVVGSGADVLLECGDLGRIDLVPQMACDHFGSLPFRCNKGTTWLRTAGASSGT